MTDRRPKLRVLLIMRDAPDTQAHKGGLFPTAIRHHVELGCDVHVASMTPMTRYHEDVLISLGATPYCAPKGTFVQTLMGKVLSFTVRERSLGNDLTTPGTIADIQRQISPDFVVGLQSYQTGLIASKIATSIGAKYVTWEHLSTYRTGRALSVSDEEVITMFKGSHAVLNVSTSLRDSILQRFSISLENTCILPNPIPLNFVDPPETPRPEWILRLPGDAFVFASWTSWRPIKRLDLLLGAFAQVHRTRNEAMLIVAGVMKDGSSDLVDAFLKDNPDIADRILFTGDIDRTSVRHLAETADCCVISSDVETFGLQMAEALSLGTPVVSTRCGGPEDVLADTRLGILCEKDSIDALGASMLEALDQRNNFDSADIARIAENLLGYEAIKGKWASVYKDR